MGLRIPMFTPAFPLGWAFKMHLGKPSHSYEIKTCLLLRRKAMTNLDSILKSRDITLPTQVCVVKATGFFSSHVQMWELDHKEGWVLRNWCFRCWRRLLRDPWTARRSNQLILKEISPEYSLEGLMLKVKLQYFGQLMQRAEGDYRGQDGWMASSTQWTWVWASSRRWWRTRKPGIL